MSTRCLRMSARCLHILRYSLYRIEKTNPIFGADRKSLPRGSDYWLCFMASIVCACLMSFHIRILTRERGNKESSGLSLPSSFKKPPKEQDRICSFHQLTSIAIMHLIKWAKVDIIREGTLIFPMVDIFWSSSKSDRFCKGTGNFGNKTENTYSPYPRALY
jgi:hypothetical protein